jgi:UDP-N-acetylmuramate--alanine ligase
LLINKEVHIHFIGIGGIGMSGIAEVLLSFGYRVSGSDLNRSDNTRKLESLGATVAIGHAKENAAGATVVVYSSAIDEENPEIIYARGNKLPLMRRAEMLAELMRLKKGVAIAGTHGKTTTTSLLATILQESRFDPTYIIGGIVDNLKGHAKVGSGEFLVAEADESDGSFLLLNPIMSIITNIDLDHMDFYKTEEKLLSCFVEFANKIPFYGILSLNIHDKYFSYIRERMKKPWTTFGIEKGEKEAADYQASNISYDIEGSHFELLYKGEKRGDIHIELPGEHNVLNAVAAISLAHQMGVEFEKISSSIQSFKGVDRRLQTIYKDQHLHVIEDYGHHPTEISATVSTVRGILPNDRLYVVFEPHRYSRTRDSWDQFLHCFNLADEVFLKPIYPASEKPLHGITTSRLVSDINKLHPKLATEFQDFSLLEEKLKNSSEQATILVLGAGSIGKDARKWVESLRH